MEKIIEQAEALGLAHCLPKFEELIKTLKVFFDNPVGNALKYSLALENLPDMGNWDNTSEFKHKYGTDTVDDFYGNGNSGKEFYGKINEKACPCKSLHRCVLDSDIIRVGDGVDIGWAEKEKLENALFNLCPWRKGPFNFFGIQVDSEWQSWIKWNRFINKISPLKGKRILDIGSSNGYYMFRMAGHDPFMVLGLEPQHTFYYQYLAAQKYLKLQNVFCLPIPFEKLPDTNGYFDIVFCMGVLYHRRSPLDMLIKIHENMAKGGELVVENLVILSDEDICLFPESRYAKMRNVFFIPSLKVMTSWLKRSGFSNIKCIDISRTNSFEQRKTPWIQTESLRDFLDPENHEKTVEGYPAPVRAIFTASF